MSDPNATTVAILASQAARLQREAAVHWSMMHHLAVSHQVAVQTTLCNRKRMAVLIALADRVVCRLTDRVVLTLGASTDARVVTISAERQRHILEGRQVVSQLDADLATRRIHEALATPVLFIESKRRPTFYEVVGFVASMQRHLRVVLKLVPASRARSWKDEWWVQTAYPFGERTRRDLARARRLRDVSA